MSSSGVGEEIECGEVENNKEQQNQEESVENEQIEEESQANVDAAEVAGNNSVDGEIEADEINLQTEVQISENIEEHNSETCGPNIESKGNAHQDDRESEDGLSNHAKLEREERSLNDQEEEIQEKDEEQRDEGSNSDKIDEQVQEGGLDDEFDKEVDLDSNNDKEEEESHQKRPIGRMIIDSDDEDKEDRRIESEHGQQSEKVESEDEVRSEEGGDVSELMQNIFGDDMSEDDEEKEGNKHGGKHDGSDDEDEPKLVRVERSEDEDEDMLGRKWDFDVMLAKKKQERRRRRRKDGSIDLMADADDQIKALVDAMNEAAAEDRNANIDRRPAIKKRKMLPIVKNTLLKADLFEAMLDNGMVSAISEWLAPLPDKSLVALEIRCSLLKILERWPNLEQGILKQSGLGRAVMYLFKHPKETRENKMIAAKLIREWSRPIFQLDSDFRSLSKEERVQRDYSQMPLAKRKRLSVDDDSSIPIFSGNKLQDDDEGKHPGDPGFIPRARVPKPSTKDYVVRPRPEIEGQFRGETKNKQVSRLVRTQRQFQQKNSGAALKRAVGVSISGKNL